MTTSHHSPRPLSKQSLSLIALMGILVMVTSGAYLWSEFRLREAELEISIQTSQLELLQTVLESESTLSSAAVDLLRQAIRGGETSAVAWLRNETQPSSAPQGVVIWSDQSRAGQLIFMTPLADPHTSIKVVISSEIDVSGITKGLVVHPTQNDHVFGLSASSQTEAWAAITVEVFTTASTTPPTRLTGSFQR